LDGAIDLGVHVYKKIAWNLIYEIINFFLLDFFVKISMHIATGNWEKTFCVQHKFGDDHSSRVDNPNI